MDGPQILAEALSAVRPEPYSDGNRWQYHSQSDRHSKVACWGVAFDMIERSALLRQHIAKGKVVVGVNHPMSDFEMDLEKKLDLVFARPAGPIEADAADLGSLADEWGVPLTPAQASRFAALPVAHVGPVGSVLVALEAKACMTAHVKSLPRLHDELNSSHLTVHGASSQAIAVGLVTINASPTFISPKLNTHDLTKHPPELSTNPQPHSAERVLGKLRQIRRRSNHQERGFDAIGAVLIDMVNDGSPVSVVTAPPAPQPNELFHYEGMLNRITHLYEVSFSHI